MLPDKQSYDQLGGELLEYAPVADPTTDLSATADNETRVDVANMTRTAIRAYVAFTVYGSTVTVDPTSYDAVYGNASSYKPIIIKNAVGNYTVTFPSSVVDARGLTHYINFFLGWCNNEDTSSFNTNVVRLTSNSFQIRNFNSSGTLADPSTSTVRISLFVL